MISRAFMSDMLRGIVKSFPILGSVRRYLNSYTSLNSVIVYFRRADLRNLPTLKNISPLYVKEMSVSEEPQIKAWFNIINQSFSTSWGKEDYIRNIINHKIYNILHTYFLMDGEKYIGVVSEAVFKKNKQVGVTHYLGLNMDYLGRGLGKYLILYALHKMKEHGLKSCEGESSLDHKKSLFIHFDFGFCPKTKLDYWNTAKHSPVLMRAIINYMFSRLYKKWKRTKACYNTGFSETPLDVVRVD